MRNGARGSASTARRYLGGQGASNDRFALGVDTVAKGVERETVRTGCIGFDQAVCEVGDIVNPLGATVGQDVRSRLRSRLRRHRAIFKLLSVCHLGMNFSEDLRGWQWGEDPSCDLWLWADLPHILPVRRGTERAADGGGWLPTL